MSEQAKQYLIEQRIKNGPVGVGEHDAKGGFENLAELLEAYHQSKLAEIKEVMLSDATSRLKALALIQSINPSLNGKNIKEINTFGGEFLLYCVMEAIEDREKAKPTPPPCGDCTKQKTPCKAPDCKAKIPEGMSGRIEKSGFVVTGICIQSLPEFLDVIHPNKARVVIVGECQLPSIELYADDHRCKGCEKEFTPTDCMNFHCADCQPQTPPKQ